MSYISLSKRGQITDSKLEKVIETVKDEIGINLSITSDQVKSVYKAIGSFITPDNAANAFNIMSRGIAGNSLRLQLILVQSAGSGLTSYISITNAIKEFPDFTWGRVARLFPMEVDNYGVAVQTVGSNTFYGFSADLDVVRSTKFKNLAYIAITLLQKHRGQEYGSLKHYQGVIKKPSKADLVKDMLDAYAPDNEELDEIGAGVAHHSKFCIG